MPAHDRGWLDDDQSLLPPWPEATQPEPKGLIRQTHSRSRSLGREDGELLAEREVLDLKVGPRRTETSKPTQHEGNSGEHRDRMDGRRSGVNAAMTAVSRYDPPCANPLFLGRMGFWRGTA